MTVLQVNDFCLRARAREQYNKRPLHFNMSAMNQPNSELKHALFNVMNTFVLDDSTDEYRLLRANCAPSFRNRDSECELIYALCETAINSELHNSFAFRYIIEVTYIMYLEIEDRRNSTLLKAFHACPMHTKIKDAVRTHYNEYPVENRNELMCYNRIELWNKLFQLALPRLKKLHKNLNIGASAYRMVSLSEAVDEKVELSTPGWLNDVGLCRFVNAYSYRILHTPADDATNQVTGDLMHALNVHVSGSSERSAKPFTNKSQALSLTSSADMAMKYGAFYLQLIPFGVFIKASHNSASRTGDILKQGKSIERIKNIAERHNEYVPNQITSLQSGDLQSIHLIHLNEDGLFEEIHQCSYLQEGWLRRKEYKVLCRPELAINNKGVIAPGSPICVTQFNDQNKKRKHSLTHEHIEIGQQVTVLADYGTGVKRWKAAIIEKAQHSAYVQFEGYTKKYPVPCDKIFV